MLSSFFVVPLSSHFCPLSDNRTTRKPQYGQAKRWNRVNSGFSVKESHPTHIGLCTSKN